MQVPSIPYTILILAPFSGESETIWSEAPIQFDKQAPDAALAAFNSSIFIPLPTALCPAGGLALTFSGRKDFTPDGLIAHQSYLTNLLEAESYLTDAEKKNLQKVDVDKGLARWLDLPPLLQQPATKAKVPRAQSDTLDTLLSMVSLPDTGKRNLKGYGAIAKQILSHIFHDPAFTAMEAACQGLQLLADECSPENEITLLLVPVHQESLEKTLDAQLPFLIQNPPALILVDLPFGGSARSIRQLAKLADIGQLLLVPTIAWITVDFFHVDDWDGFERLSFLPHHMKQPAFIKWQKVRRSPAARWLGLFCNRFLSRYPYGPDNRPRHIDFVETENPWLSPVWAVGKLIGQRVKRSNWPTGIQAGQTNRIEGLALDHSNVRSPMPVEKTFTDARLEQLERCGIAAFVSRRGSDSIFLSSNIMASSDVGLDHQSLTCLVTRFTLWCKDTFTEDIQVEELPDALQRAWRSYLDTRKIGYGEMPLNVEICRSEQEIIVCCKWRPSEKILPSGEELVLEVAW
jgi:type VI secretion system protein ImpC